MTWMNVWKSWAERKGLNDDIVKYEAKELDECLSRFFAEICKSDGSDYEPDSLRVMLATIDRQLKENDSKITIAKDREFVKYRQVLEGKARALREKGHGKRPNATKALTVQDEEQLWKNRVLGEQNPKSLLYTLWYLLTLHPCPIHPHRLESSKSTDDSTYRKSSCKRKRILCLPEVNSWMSEGRKC